jgi:hypothetical protein
MEMTYDILYSLRGDRYIERHLKTVKTEAAARKIVRNIAKLPPGVIHYAITCDDGRTIHDSSRDGLL